MYFNPSIHPVAVLIPVVALIGLFGMPITAIAMYWWCEIRKATCEASLKQAMVERGYSVNEILLVVASGKSKPKVPAFDPPPAKLTTAPIGA